MFCVTSGPCNYIQEEQLRSSEALVADFQKSLHQRDSELETLRTKVSCTKLTLYPLSVNTVIAVALTVTYSQTESTELPQTRGPYRPKKVNIVCVCVCVCVCSLI